MRHYHRSLPFVVVVIVLLLFLPFSLCRPFLLILSQDDLKEVSSPADEPDRADSAEWDDFGDSEPFRSELDLDPGSWRPILEPDDQTLPRPSADGGDSAYLSAVRKIIYASSEGDTRAMDEVASEIEAAATDDMNSMSLMGFMYGVGMGKERNKGKAFLYHYFAANCGSLQSKMALAFFYLRQDVSSIS